MVKILKAPVPPDLSLISILVYNRTQSPQKTTCKTIKGVTTPMKFSEMQYQRIDFEKVLSELKELEEALANAGSAEEQFAVHQRFYLLQDHVMTQFTLATIRNDINMADDFYSEEKKYYDAELPGYHAAVVSYKHKLFRSRFRAELTEILGPVAFKNMELAEKSVNEALIPLMQEENTLATEYNKLLASASIDWQGEKKNLSLMEPYLRHRDRKIRVEAWQKYTEFFSEHQEKIDDIYDKLVKNRTAQGQKMGYDNYLPLGDCRMMRNCYTRSDMQNFRKQVKEDLVPFAEKLHERRRQRLGLEKLHYYDEDVYFTNGNPAPIGTPEDILAAGLRMYTELSPETARFMKTMCDMELFDVAGRPNKRTGGYMTMLPDYKVPFIFANFNGSSGDADVITHECGHAFQGYLTAADPIREHNDLTMDIAESHSMPMEFFTNPWMELLFGARAEDYRTMQFEDAVTFIPYGTMVDEFQEIVYQNPGLTSHERDAVWLDLEKQYRPHMDYTGNTYLSAGGFWKKQHHIFDLPLYYIDYCLAGTNQLQYKLWMGRDYREAWQSYMKLVKLSASDFFNGVVEKAGLINPFEDGCLRYIIKKLEKDL